ncbi:hypothetical protein FACS1894216_15340 [Synergistales bacterium]|nr:hypothetical protein FACS1894216_15340 [Synergistales bacterium]
MIAIFSGKTVFSKSAIQAAPFAAIFALNEKAFHIASPGDVVHFHSLHILAGSACLAPMNPPRIRKIFYMAVLTNHDEA